MLNETTVLLCLMKRVAEHVAARGAKLVFVSSYNLDLIAKHTATEMWLKHIVFGPQGVGDRIAWLKSSPLHFTALYGDLPHYSPEYIRNIFEPVANLPTRRGRMNVNFRSDYVNIDGGVRFTLDQPGSYDHSIFCIGGSSVYGYGCEDAHTLPSFLQKIVNENAASLNNSYCVLNLGARGMPKFLDFYKALKLPVQSGDIVVLQGIDDALIVQMAALQSENLQFLSPNYAFRHAEGDVFFDRAHVNYKGHKNIARQIFDCVFKAENNPSDQSFWPISSADDEFAEAVFYKATHIYREPQLRESHDSVAGHPGLSDFIDELKTLDVGAGSVGVTVVNCNPFTLGHQHLIEYAAASVDHLVIFVVEENRSQFDFAMRYELVVQGTSHLSNISVVRSGRFMLSALTCPEYFSKEELPYAAVDASIDLNIFGEYIAPALNVSVRFIGEEPLCAITRQHNQQMKNILPTYGVRVEEIQRLAVEDQVVSASRVRVYLQSQRVEELKKLVPPTTLKIILADPALDSAICNRRREDSAY